MNRTHRAFARLLVAVLVISWLAIGLSPRAAHAATCVSSIGPGLAPPAQTPSGMPGFHAHWYGQSGYQTLCPGERSSATVAYLNSGTRPWVQGRMGEAAYLGTWGPEPGQDQASPLGGPQTGWPSGGRIAQQTGAWIGPGQVGWFQFTIHAPETPGRYRLYLRPLIEGATWMEDFGVFWTITVLNADGTQPVASSASVSTPTGYSRVSVPTSRGTFVASLIKERMTDVTVRTVTGGASDCFSDCPVKSLASYVSEYGAYAGMNGTYLCPPDYSWCAGKVNSYEYAVFNSFLGRWINDDHLISPTNALVTFEGDAPRFYQNVRSYDRGRVTAGISNFPLLLEKGVVLDTEGEQTAAQKARGTKGSIGTDGTFVYLTLVSNASLTEAAYVLQALGVRDAMNLDGGGTSAMWIGGSYKVGPGRLLPNAVLLTKP